jgi:Domain of unknown function (DUF4340)
VAAAQAHDDRRSRRPVGRMSARGVGILLAAAILVIAGSTWLAAERRPDRDAVAGSAILPELESVLNEVSEVRIAKGDGTRTTLRRNESGWIVAERDFPADSGRVRKLLIDLAGLEVVEEKTSDPASYAKLGVEDVNSPQASGTRVEAVAPNRAIGVIVGKPSGKSVFVRTAGKAKSYLATPSMSADADPKRWIDRNIVDIPRERVKEVSVKPADAPAYAVTRETREQTDFTVAKLPKGRRLSSPSAANPVAESLAGLTLDDVRRPPSEGESTELDVAKFRTFDGLELELHGRKDGDKRLVTVTATASQGAVSAEAQSIEKRLKDRELEIPGYKYEAIFRPIDELLAPKGG